MDLPSIGCGTTRAPNQPCPPARDREARVGGSAVTPFEFLARLPAVRVPSPGSTTAGRAGLSRTTLDSHARSGRQAVKDQQGAARKRFGAAERPLRNSRTTWANLCVYDAGHDALADGCPHAQAVPLMATLAKN